jgi:hypothetical protein
VVHTHFRSTVLSGRSGGRSGGRRGGVNDHAVIAIKPTGSIVAGWVTHAIADPTSFAASGTGGAGVIITIAA